MYFKVGKVGTKIILITLGILFFAIGSTTLISGYIFSREYTDVLKSKLSIVGESLKSQLDRVLAFGIPLRELVGFEEQCQEIINRYKEISYAMVVDKNGEILFHNDPSNHHKIVTCLTALQAVKKDKETIQVCPDEGGKYLEFIHPIFDGNGEHIGAIRVGFPLNIITEKTKQLVFYSVGVALVFFTLAVLLLVLGLSTWITKPLMRLLTVIQEIREKGTNFTRRVEIKSKDEIGQLASAFDKMMEDLQRTTVSKDYVDNIIESMMDALIVVDPDGKIQTVNKATCDLLGYPPNEMIGKSIDAILPTPGYLDEQGEIENFEASLKRKEGGTIPVLLSSSVMRDKSGNIEWIVCTARDITERKQAEETLRESEDRYRDLVECSQYLILTHNLEGQVLSINHGGATYLGYEPKDFLKKNIRDLLPHGVKDEFGTYLDTIRKQGSAKGLMLVQTATGEKRVWEYDNTLRTEGVTMPIVRSISHDITERLQAEKAVRRLSQENAIMAEIGRIISSTLNIQEVYGRFAAEVGKLISFDRISVSTVNPDGRSVTIAYVWGAEVPDRKQGDILSSTGSLYEEIRAKRSGILIQVEDEEELAKSYSRLLSNFRAGFRSMISVPLISKDQLIGILNFRSFKSKNYRESDLGLTEKVGNQIAGAIANAQLFMERVQAEEERTALQEQLRQSQKMEAIGQLAGGVAHDFNNLLTVIQGYCDLILKDLDEKSRFFEDMTEIHKASERAALLTRQLLAFSRKQVLQPKVLDLNKVVLNMEKMLRRMIGEDIELATVLEKSLGRVKADPGQIEQVILNLAINARDAMSNGGKLMLETSNTQLDEHYAQSHVSVIPGRYIRLSVSDTGMGMSPEIRERIFEPFFTTKEKGKGTGLGLSTVYGIVKQSGGNIWVYSEPGQGTTFKIYLPTIEEGTTNPFVSTLVLPQSLQGSETILLVEDENAVRRLASTILQNNGYKVLEAANGEEALHMVHGIPPQSIHLMLTDVVMPRMSGRQLADRVESWQPTMKVLYMSGYTDNAIVHHGVLDPGTAYIQKPFTPDTLVSKIREVLDNS